MNTSLKKIIFASALISFVSCKNEDLLPTNSQTTEIISSKKSSNTYDFLGEKVNVPEDITLSDLKIYFTNQHIDLSSKSLRVNYYSDINVELVPYKVLIGFIEQSKKNYPDLDKKDFSDTELKNISNDIVGITSKEDANNKRSVIFEYYNFRISKDIEKSIKQYLKGNKGVRIKGISDYYGANGLEIALTAADPLGGFKVNQARNQAVTMVEEVYPGQSHDSNDAINAFKHCAWNALSVQELVSASWNKWTSLERAKKFTCAHEYQQDSNGDWVQMTGDVNAMDLSNNLVGRTYMYETVNQHWWGTSNNPSNSEIKSAIQGFTSTQKSGATDIFSQSSSLNWSSIGDYNSAMNYHTEISTLLVHL